MITLIIVLLVLALSISVFVNFCLWDLLGLTRKLNANLRKQIEIQGGTDQP